MNKCPQCGHEWPDTERAKGGKARWQGTTAKTRSAATSKAARARWGKPKKDKPAPKPKAKPQPAPPTMSESEAAILARLNNHQLRTK